MIAVPGSPESCAQSKLGSSNLLFTIYNSACDSSPGKRRLQIRGTMNKKQIRLSRIVRGFQGRRVAVLGDYILDEFLRGEATRISPEAPVPVILIQDHNTVRDYPGGAGNVAASIASLGGRPIPYGSSATIKVASDCGRCLRVETSRPARSFPNAGG